MVILSGLSGLFYLFCLFSGTQVGQDEGHQIYPSQPEQREIEGTMFFAVRALTRLSGLFYISCLSYGKLVMEKNA